VTGATALPSAEPEPKAVPDEHSPLEEPEPQHVVKEAVTLMPALAVPAVTATTESTICGARRSRPGVDGIIRNGTFYLWPDIISSTDPPCTIAPYIAPYPN
jgi:hypothetical protein